MEKSTLSDTLARQRPIPGVRVLDERLRRLSPGDQLIVGVCALLMMAGAFVALAQVSRHFMVEVPAHGGTHVEGVVGTPRFINPLLAISDADQSLTTLTYAGLLKQNSDGTLAPDLAQGYTVSPDGRTYTVIIRPDALFQDGRAVTPEDVVFTVEMAQSPSIASPARANWDGVQVAATDARTVTFTLKSPYAPFADNLTLGILPKHLWEKVTPEEFPFSSLNLAPVGAGPYSVNSV